MTITRRTTSGRTEEVRPSFIHGGPEENGKWTRESIRTQLAENSRDLLEQILTELRTLNRTLACTSFQAIPNVLKRISRNTAKPRRKAAPAAGG
jgi:hypothetical protein